jgi:hypothetical protein
MKNRMRELRTCGSVRGEGREALAYSETKNPPVRPRMASRSEFSSTVM